MLFQGFTPKFSTSFLVSLLNPDSMCFQGLVFAMINQTDWKLRWWSAHPPGRGCPARTHQPDRDVSATSTWTLNAWEHKHCAFKKENTYKRRK